MEWWIGFLVYWLDVWKIVEISGFFYVFILVECEYFFERNWYCGFYNLE